MTLSNNNQSNNIVADDMEVVVKRVHLRAQDQSQRVKIRILLPGMTTGLLTIIPALCVRIAVARLEESTRYFVIRLEELVSQKILEQSHALPPNF